MPPAPVPPATVPVVGPLAAITAILADVRAVGKLRVGRTLKLTGMMADCRATVGYKIRWFAGTKPIRKAARPSLRLTSTLRGKLISVKVTAVSSGVSKTRKIKVGRVR